MAGITRAKRHRREAMKVVEAYVSANNELVSNFQHVLTTMGCATRTHRLVQTLLAKTSQYQKQIGMVRSERKNGRAEFQTALHTQKRAIAHKLFEPMRMLSLTDLYEIGHNQVVQAQAKGEPVVQTTAVAAYVYAEKIRKVAKTDIAFECDKLNAVYSNPKLDEREFALVAELGETQTKLHQATKRRDTLRAEYQALLDSDPNIGYLLKQEKTKGVIAEEVPLPPKPKAKSKAQYDFRTKAAQVKECINKANLARLAQVQWEIIPNHKGVAMFVTVNVIGKPVTITLVKDWESKLHALDATFAKSDGFVS
jgi:hypothetical protein